MPSSSGEPYTPQPTQRTIRIPKKEPPTPHTEDAPVRTPTPEKISTQVDKVQEVPTKTKWPTYKKVILGVIIAAICLAIIMAIVLAVVLTRKSSKSTLLNTLQVLDHFRSFQQNNRVFDNTSLFVKRSTSETSSSTTSTTITYVSWSFDNATTDLYGVYNGQMVNSATYSPSSSTQPYLGQGRALSVTSGQNQSFQVPTPFLSLASTSFTIEAWVYSSTVTGDNGIMGQCQCSACSNQCFFLLIRSSRLYAGFTLNDVSGLTTLSVNTWYHVAFVYNSVTQQQILYLNGVQDNIKSSAASYQGTNGTFTIGAAYYFSSVAFLSGYIDNVKIQTTAKSDAEILTAASLIAYYSFDLPNPTNDNGPNGLNGSSTNAASVTGRVNQALRFTGSSSYFQAYGFYQTGFGVYPNKAFSVSMWISASSYTSCAFVQMSTTATGGSCFNMLGIWSYTGNAAQLVAQGYAWPTIYGPPITLNTWTHISWTFSLANGYRLYVNGVYFATTGYYSYGGTSGAINWIQIGYNFGCSSAYITSAAFQGIIDEVYVHNREITTAEVNTLANP